MENRFFSEGISIFVMTPASAFYLWPEGNDVQEI